MFFKKRTEDKTIAPAMKLEQSQDAKRTDESSEEDRIRELRRQFYEHLAQAHAHAEAEENARRKWQSR